jgi:serine/threonine protein kinase
MNNIFKALTYIHSKNVIHRDLKLENIIIKSKMNLELSVIDFGLADFYDPEGANQLQLCGTVGYIAPEILYNEIYDFKVDVFSAGIIMYTLMIGKNPFDG